MQDLRQRLADGLVPFSKDLLSRSVGERNGSSQVHGRVGDTMTEQQHLVLGGNIDSKEGIDQSLAIGR